MADESIIQAERPAKRRPLRTIFWVLAAGFGLMFLLNVLFPDLDLSTEDRIALIRVEGVIMDSQTTVGELKRFSENPSVKAIVLRIDSPGGGVVPSQEIHDAVKRVRTKNNKTVIASMGSVAASGGYYIAAATDRIVANPGTLTGSIGVIMETANVEGLLQKIGIEGVVIKSGKFKDVGSPLRKMSEEERGLLQAVMDDVHKQFIEVVRKGRGKRLKETPELFSGLMWTGDQAVQLGLADGFGSVEYVAREVIKAEDIKDFTVKQSLADRLARQFGADVAESMAGAFARLRLR